MYTYDLLKSLPYSNNVMTGMYPFKALCHPPPHYLLFNFFIIILVTSRDCAGGRGEGGALRVILRAPVAIPPQLVTLCRKTEKRTLIHDKSHYCLHFVYNGTYKNTEYFTMH